MEKIRYIHGSGDSLDVDVFYVFDKKPTYQECHIFCSNTDENRNIIVIENGYVIDCFKGTIDEVQNSLIDTYGLHEQEYPLLISEKVQRNIILKTIRVVRCFLSHFSRTKYRDIVKKALKSHIWKEKINTIEKLDLNIIDFSKNDIVEIHKVFAFQLAQIMGLYENVEIYTKSDASIKYPKLKKYLYREKDADMSDLIDMFDIFIQYCKSINVEQYETFVNFVDYNIKIDIKNEKII